MAPPSEEPPLPPAPSPPPAAPTPPVPVSAGPPQPSPPRRAATTTTTHVPPTASPAPISIGSLAKPRGGPRALITRIGIILVGLLILATLGVGGYTVIVGMRNRNNNNAGTSATGNPSPTASGGPSVVYFKYSDPKFEFSIDRPADWTSRVLDVPDPAIALILGPQPPYSVQDSVSVQFHQLPIPLGPGDLVPFKDSIRQGLEAHGDNIVDFSPTPVVNGMVGYYFLYTFPGSNPPTGLHAAYYLLNGDREILITLQIEPYNDTAGFQALYPIFQHMAQSVVSFHVPPSAGPRPTGTATTVPTATATP